MRILKISNLELWLPLGVKQNSILCKYFYSWWNNMDRVHQQKGKCSPTQHPELGRSWPFSLFLSWSCHHKFTDFLLSLSISNRKDKNSKLQKRELFILFGFKGKKTSCQSEYLAFVISKSMFSVRNTAEVFSLVYYDQHFWDRILRHLFVNIQEQKLHPQKLDLFYRTKWTTGCETEKLWAKNKFLTC